MGKTDKGAAHDSGQLAEAACLEVFNVEEDEHYEIKACCSGDARVIIKLSQLERFQNKTYVVVLYDRGKRKHKKGKRKYEREVREAYYDVPLEFLFIPAVELGEIIAKSRSRISWIRDSRRGGEGTFKVYVKADEIKDHMSRYLSCAIQEGRGYNGQSATAYGHSIPAVVTSAKDELPPPF